MGAQGSSSAPPQGSNPAMTGSGNFVSNDTGSGGSGILTPKGSSSAPLSQPQMSTQTSADPSAAYSYTNPNNMQRMAQQMDGRNFMGGQFQQPPPSAPQYGQQGRPDWMQSRPYMSGFMNRMQDQGFQMPQGFGQIPQGYQGILNQLLANLPANLQNNPQIMQAVQPFQKPMNAPGYKQGGRVSQRKITSQEMQTLAQALAIAKRIMGK